MPMSDIFDYLNKLYGMPGYALVAISCIVIGYVLRAIRGFPNSAIPLSCVFWAMVINPILADAPPAGASHRVWYFKCAIIGMIIGFAAWTFHRVVLNRFEDKIPGFKKLMGEDDPPTVGTIAGTITPPK